MADIRHTNPFILRGYAGKEYFCDRIEETKRLCEEIANGNNVAIIAERRLGKTGLIYHLFNRPEIKKRYYTFVIDIYATKNIQEMVNEIGRNILSELKPMGTKAVSQFVNMLQSLRSQITFDAAGTPTWNVGLGDISTPDVTLDEIFRYLSAADKHCIVAIDEFQTITTYPEKGIEALLRTHIQHCHNASFIFSGSRRTMMSEIFLSHARPFYQSTSIMTIGPIDKEKYADFATTMFRKGDKNIDRDTIYGIYRRFDGITWYVQKLMNKLYSMTAGGETCTADMAEAALSQLISDSTEAYQFLLYQLPAKQKEQLLAISKAGKATAITSSAFVKKYRLPSPSSVQSAVKGLIEKDFVTVNKDTYEVYDRFFAIWLNQL
ncbi:MAG: ATP-binding protein [Prevotella sp.]|nr:ATP-binding protein [Prevotella sp.]